MTDMTYTYIVLGFSMVSGLIGYYIGERGVTGVKNDINNVKLDIENIKGKLSGTTLPNTGVVTLPSVISGDGATTPAA